jgi:hypothetical protein
MDSLSVTAAAVATAVLAVPAPTAATPAGNARSARADKEFCRMGARSSLVADMGRGQAEGTDRDVQPNSLGIFADEGHQTGLARSR